VDSRRKRIQKYFTSKFPKWAPIMIAIGVIVIVVGFSSNDRAPLALLGLLFAAGGGVGIYSHTQTPSDQQIDKWTEEHLLSLYQRALNKTGIDQSEVVGDPVTIAGPSFEKGGRKRPDRPLWKFGKDKRLRFSDVKAAIINFTQHQLVVYLCTVDLIAGSTLNEATEEYFYRDVVSVSTFTKPLDAEIAVGKGKDGSEITVSEVEYFALTTSAGTSVLIPLLSPEIEKQFGGETPTTASQRAIQTVRKMLRERKGAAAGF
jgi:hypothetical protein